MAKQNKLSKYWTGVHKSAEYQECLVYPVSMVKGGIGTIFDAMYTIITAFLRYLAEQTLITATPATLAAFFHDYEEQNAILFNQATDMT